MWRVSRMTSGCSPKPTKSLSCAGSPLKSSKRKSPAPRTPSPPDSCTSCGSISQSLGVRLDSATSLEYLQKFLGEAYITEKVLLSPKITINSKKVLLYPHKKKE